MNNVAAVIVLAEGPTEQVFIKTLLSQYFAVKGIFLTPILLSKPGQKGGDVRFIRAQKDIGNHLKQRHDTYITLMVDYYGINKDWPGFEESKRQSGHRNKAEIINRETEKIIQTLFPDQNRGCRFIPYISMHEIEALYFSEPKTLARIMDIKPEKIEDIIRECGEPEAINDGFDTAPARRLEKLSKKFKKIATGIAIAKMVGIRRIRECCPLFDAWMNRIENLQPDEKTAKNEV